MNQSGKGYDPDVDLCAYLDDECGPGQRRRAESALSQDPALTRKLAVWRRNDSALRAAFSPMDAPNQAPGRPASIPLGEPPIRSPEVAAGPRNVTRLAVAAAFLAGALSASGALFILRLASG